MYVTNWGMSMFYPLEMVHVIMRGLLLMHVTNWQLSWVCGPVTN